MSDWHPINSPVPCRKCKAVGRIERSKWSSSDGAHEDLFYRCRACEGEWCIEGGDS